MPRFRAFYGDLDPSVLSRVFTRQEQRGALAWADAVVYLALCFAAKEAVLKTIDGLEQSISLTEVDISAPTWPRPMVTLTGGAAAAAAIRGVSHHWLATARSRTATSAFAIALGDGTPGTDPPQD